MQLKHTYRSIALTILATRCCVLASNYRHLGDFHHFLLYLLLNLSIALKVFRLVSDLRLILSFFLFQKLFATCNPKRPPIFSPYNAYLLYGAFEFFLECKKSNLSQCHCCGGTLAAGNLSEIYTNVLRRTATHWWYFVATTLASRQTRAKLALIN